MTENVNQKQEKKGKREVKPLIKRVFTKEQVHEVERKFNFKVDEEVFRELVD